MHPQDAHLAGPGQLRECEDVALVVGMGISAGGLGPSRDPLSPTSLTTESPASTTTLQPDAATAMRTDIAAFEERARETMRAAVSSGAFWTIRAAPPGALADVEVEVVEDTGGGEEGRQGGPPMQSGAAAAAARSVERVEGTAQT